jgi:Fur family transcriptional regulator, ferric uptake regulator
VTDGFDQVLRARGLRATPQRRLVLDAVAALGHGTPEQVCDRVQEVAPSLSLSTVYRTLELLEDLGVVSHTHLGHGAPTYHPISHADHIHLVCRRCGAVSQADVVHARELAGEVRRRHGFTVDVTHLALDGVCQACRADVGAEIRAEIRAGADHGVAADTEAVAGEADAPGRR